MQLKQACAQQATSSARLALTGHAKTQQFIYLLAGKAQYKLWQCPETK